MSISKLFSLLGMKKSDEDESQDEFSDEEFSQRQIEEDTNHRYSLWKLLTGKLGMDVSGVTIPVGFFEPTTLLTRMAEMLHFADLLNKAAEMQDPTDKMAYVVAFAITGYNGTDRYYKPFNSLLGETFEFIDEDTGTRFFSEQVSHHPPVGAAFAENDKFQFWQQSIVKTRFHGNSIDIDTQGGTHVYFPSTQDHFRYICPTTRVNNLLVGTTWCDHFGKLICKNLKTGDSCVLYFEKAGWRGKGKHEFSGYITDSNGKDTHFMSGKWSEYIHVKWLHNKGKQTPGTTVRVWKRPENNAIGKYNLTEFAMRLTEMDSNLEKILPSTDSRLRPDRRYLEKGEMSLASTYKQLLEERQRRDRREREIRNEVWTPRWFTQIEDPKTKEVMWSYTGNYWERRQLKEDLILQGSASPKEIEQCLDFGISNLACDFRSYQ